MIDIHWQILEEEGRCIKAIADLSKITCRFIAKFKDSSSSIQSETKSIDSFEKFQKIAQSQKDLSNYFGKTSSEQHQIKELLQIYQAKVKPKMKMPILQYYQSYNAPLPRELLSNKFIEIEEGMKVITQILSHKKGTFVCGEQIKVIDILLFFDVCNLFYFGKNHTQYPELKEWFQSVYKIKPVLVVTHQWFSMAKQIMRSLRPRKSKPKL